MLKLNQPNYSNDRLLTIKGSRYTLNQLQELKRVSPAQYTHLQAQAQKELVGMKLSVTNSQDMQRFQDKIDFAFGNGDGELSLTEQIRLKNATPGSGVHNFSFLDP